ncbi:hypothetical protein [Streptomyces sp. NPDC060001]|uniref:hypothetical protein n=1 Tax=Streptomyces sp. NPDC060001 TaxID=3347032 RepID=UPI0036AD7B9C
MTLHTATCVMDADDQITAHSTGRRVALTPTGSDVYLNPLSARTFARGILALADGIDGGEAEETPTPRPKVGDRVRVVADDPYTKTGEFVGRTGVVRTVQPDGRTMPYRVRLDDSSGTWDEGSWWCAKVELVDDPAPLAGESAPARSSRAKYVEEAKALLEGAYFDAASIVTLAQFLADDE